MASAKNLADSFIGAAHKYPDARQDIFRKAAQAFMGLAQNPKNAKVSRKLSSIGADFALAATRERPPTMDDFVDLLRESQVAYEETGNHPMDNIARSREIHEQRTPIRPGHVSIAPESFNKDATLGRTAVIKFQPTNDEIIRGVLQMQNVAFWQGSKKEAQAMTVDTSLGFLPPLPPPIDPVPINNRPFVEVEFGSDGNRTKIKYDLSLSNRCTVVGNYVAVTIGMGPPYGFDFVPPHPSTTTEITAGASIGCFAAPSQAPLILTEYVDNLFFSAGIGSRLIPIPLKAVQLLPIQTNFALGQTATLQFFDYGGMLISQNFYLQSSVAMSPIPITGDVAFVKVFNDGGPAFGNFRLPFQIAM